MPDGPDPDSLSPATPRNFQKMVGRKIIHAPRIHRPVRCVLKIVMAGLLFAAGCTNHASETADARSGGARFDPKTKAYRVHPGESIQAALDAAANDPVHKTVIVQAGTYRPAEPGPALIWFNGRHEGITLEAEGDVVLTAANPDIADRSAPSYPAVVTHVVFFGDGISRRTVLRGFKITGANNYIHDRRELLKLEPNVVFRKGLVFYRDGGGIKILGRSYPTIENVEVYGNYTGICGGGASVEHWEGVSDQSVLFKNCIFRDNRTGVTGSAIDLLYDSSATIENCLFVGNVSNTGADSKGISPDLLRYNEEHGSGALTVFPRSRATVTNSTFADNRSGVDDKGTGSRYENNIFWNNIRSGGTYELDLSVGTFVTGNFIHGENNDLRGVISSSRNTLDPEDPLFDAGFVPQSEKFRGVGYRPLNRDLSAGR